MIRFLPSPVLGAIAFLLFTVNTVFWCVLLFFFVLIKLLVPIPTFRRMMSRVLTMIATAWIDGNRLIVYVTQRIHWDVEGLDHLSKKLSYLVVSNHRSWTDIPVLQNVLNHRVPFLKFFLKQELIWVPLLGVAWWALDFPFLKRYSRRFLEKHPELRGKDMETTRRQCAKFRDSAVSVMNFLEGTRFTIPKHRRQQSPYQHLLLPRAGGVAMVLSNMGDYLSHILDVTIVYPDNGGAVRFWDLLSGKLSTIVVRVRALPIPDNVAGKDYGHDQAYRERIQAFVNRLWEEKDKQIEALLIHYDAAHLAVARSSAAGH